MVDDFVPEIWSANLLQHLAARLVFGSEGLTNRDYEGDIAQAGDTVHITQMGDITVGSYTAENDISVESIADSTQALVIDQAKYFAFDVDDVVRRQALPGWVAAVTQRAAYKFAQTLDSYLSNLMYVAAHNTANDLGDQTSDTSDNSAYGILVALRQKLVEAGCPMDGLWCVVPTGMYAQLLQDSRFVNAQASADGGAALHNGFIGRAAGFDIYESTTVPQVTSGIYNVIAGSPLACTLAFQITKVEAQEREKRFGQLVKGLNLYGAKVVQPGALATAAVTIQA